MSYVQALYHIVICTKYRSMTIDNANKTALYKYIWGVIDNCNCKLLKINGIPNHIHMLVELHPTVCMSDLIRDVKRASSLYAKESGLFPLFDGWSAEYGAFTCSYSMKERIEKYIQSQEEHHGKEAFESEYRRLATLHGLKYYEPSSATSSM